MFAAAEILPRDAAVAVQELCHPTFTDMIKRKGKKDSSCRIVAAVVEVVVALLLLFLLVVVLAEAFVSMPRFLRVRSSSPAARTWEADVEIGRAHV